VGIGIRVRVSGQEEERKRTEEGESASPTTRDEGEPEASHRQAAEKARSREGGEERRGGEEPGSRGLGLGIRPRVQGGVGEAGVTRRPAGSTGLGRSAGLAC
jgi:hypothetical protein